MDLSAKPSPLSYAFTKPTTGEMLVLLVAGETDATYDGVWIIGRDRQSLEGTVKRAAAAGVILFGDVFACNASSLPVTKLDEWWAEHHRSVSAPLGSPQLEKTLEEIDDMIEEEHGLWKTCEERLKKQRPDIKIKGMCSPICVAYMYV